MYLACCRRIVAALIISFGRNLPRLKIQGLVDARWRNVRALLRYLEHIGLSNGEQCRSHPRGRRSDGIIRRRGQGRCRNRVAPRLGRKRRGIRHLSWAALLALGVGSFVGVAGVAILSVAPAAAASCDDVWVNGAGGAWGVAANWSTAAVPTGSSNVCIGVGTSSATGTFTVTMPSSESVASLTLGATTGSQTQTLDVSGSTTFSFSANSVISPDHSSDSRPTRSMTSSAA